jgi:DNA-binding beta-propeller fold protein YncE
MRENHMTILGSPERRYERVPTWPKLPSRWEIGSPTDAAVSSVGEIYVLSRNSAHPLTIWDAEGNFLGSWGEGTFSAVPHGIYVAPDDTVWIVDRDYHVATQYTAAGMPLRQLGQKLAPSPTCDGRVVRSRPFNMPTNLAIASSGSMFVADGYGNHKVHRFAPDGSLELSWGQQGSGPGEFALVHNVWIDSRDRVFVCDDENDRIQIFDQDGGFLEEWKFANPSGLCIHDDVVYVLELQPFAGAQRGSGRISLWTLDRDFIASWNGSDGDGELMIGPHDLCVDHAGSIYVCEGRGQRVSKFVLI